MRQLVKAKNNLMNAELYATERPVTKNAKVLTCVSIVSPYRPYTSKCRAGNYHVRYGECYKYEYEEKNFQRDLAEASASGYCDIEFTYNDHYYGYVQTPYHLEGRCQQ